MVLFRVDCLFYYPLYYFEFWVLRFGARLGRGGGGGGEVSCLGCHSLFTIHYLESVVRAYRRVGRIAVNRVHFVRSAH